jgi:ferredoxin
MDSSCGTCEVIILEGADSLSPVSSKETATKAANQISEAHRLGCQTAVLGDGAKVQIVNVLGADGEY